MRLKVLLVTTLLVVCGFLVVTSATLAQSRNQSETLTKPIVVEPSLICERAAARPGLHLIITNRSPSNIAAGRTIQFSYQLTPANLNGEGKIQLTHSLLSGQTLDVSLGEVKAGSIQACSAIVLAPTIVQGPVIKLPYVVAPRQP